MDVQINHNGDNVTAYLDNYTRSQKICSGIGTLEISFVNTFPSTLEPGDIIVLREGGIKKGTYYVSVVNDSIPDGMISASCQDGSKKLTDYFIAESYTVDYPSYSRAWIEQFLSEAQVDYSFNTASVGNLLSNNTSLGLATAYDQIVPLLQMNGWYIYFDADNTAIIGKLTKNVGDISETLNKDDILDIKVSKSDKMLRNRVVVWGNADPTTSSWVYSDMSTHTKWNYDRNDYRTAVISNSNIPNTATANNLAKQALTEFAQITIEKDINCHGDRDIKLGEFVFVKSNVYKGIGLVTTIGSSLSKDGFTTNIILDERCPRLFSYFDFGDYVYVSTMGSGIWRKHIEFDHTWNDYSEGLDDLRVTDLYKNNGVLSSVTASGQAYYNLDITNIWTPITISGLMTVLGVDAEEVPISGAYTQPITARAIIHDKATNNIRVAASTNTAENYIDYATGVDVLVSGGMARSWIVDYNPITEVIDNSYPIHVSGVYDMAVLDIENDGTTDYVTVAVSGTVIGVINNEFIFGQNEGQQWQEQGKVSLGALNYASLNYDVLIPTDATTNIFMQAVQAACCTYDNYSVRAFISCYKNITTGKNYFFGKFLNYNTLDFSEAYFVELPSTVLRWLGIHQVTKYTYKLFCDTTTTNEYRFYDVDLQAGTATQTASYIIDKTDITADSFNQGTVVNGFVARSRNIVYGIKVEQFGADATHNQTSSKLYVIKANIETGLLTEILLLDTSSMDGYLTTQFAISSYGDLGPLIKIGFVRFEENILGKVDNVFRKIINFVGDDFEMFEQAESESEVTPNIHFPSQIAVNGLSGSAFNTYVNSFFMGRATTSDSSVPNIESIYPLKEEYNSPATNPTNATYTQTGGLLTDTFFGIDIGSNTAGIYNIDSKTLRTSLPIPVGYNVRAFCPHLDSVNGNLYLYAINNSTTDAELLEYNQSGTLINTNPLGSDGTDTAAVSIFNSGNFLIILAGDLALTIAYIRAYQVLTGQFILYELLKRNDTEFTILRIDPLNMRLDNSLSSPLISVDNTLSTTSLNYNYLDGHEFINIITDGPLEDTFVEDFRYLSTDVIPVSGYGTTFAFANSDGIHLLPITPNGLDLTQDAIIFTPASGVVSRLETTNYKLPYQYIFATTSGISATASGLGAYSFFQSNPTASGFTEYSEGFPGALPTRIRIDDRI